MATIPPRSAVAPYSCAGQARHYRVQFQTANDAVWQRYASFQDSEPARCCAQQLREQGLRSRVVHFATMPVAGEHTTQVANVGHDQGTGPQPLCQHLRVRSCCPGARCRPFAAYRRRCCYLEPQRPVWPPARLSRSCRKVVEHTAFGHSRRLRCSKPVRRRRESSSPPPCLPRPVRWRRRLVDSRRRASHIPSPRWPERGIGCCEMRRAVSRFQRPWQDRPRDRKIAAARHRRTRMRSQPPPAAAPHTGKRSRQADWSWDTGRRQHSRPWPNTDPVGHPPRDCSGPRFRRGALQSPSRGTSHRLPTQPRWARCPDRLAGFEPSSPGWPPSVKRRWLALAYDGRPMTRAKRVLRPPKVAGSFR